MDVAFNITLVSLQYAVKAYDVASKSLQDHNVTLPSPQFIAYTIQSAAQHLGNAATSAGLPQYWKDILVNYNILPAILALVWLYMLFSLFTMTLRWIYRAIFGFVRFSLIICTVAFVVYHVQMYLSKDGEFVDSTPLSSNPRVNYLRQQGIIQ
ncbi:hypothetical protein BGW37DRAFT_284517 [Umbelopsis sp. PMI_123]|jgi:hypothetical protein|nr:hypothetical protein BGW37DRAFT_284517 [Umbelopsis sp. PMI_123]